MDQCTTVGAELDRVMMRWVVAVLRLVVGTITKTVVKSRLQHLVEEGRTVVINGRLWPPLP